MYEYTPKRENNKAANLILLMLIGGFAVLGVTSALPNLPFRWVFQIAGIAFVGVGVYLYTRYFARTFSYALIAREDGSMDLTVTECQRKSRVTVCRLSLGGIERMEVIKGAEAARQKALKKELKKEGRHLFFYTVNLLPSSVCYLVATECGQPLAICFEPDERMLKMLGLEE